jgi:hypothetical protein
MGNPTPVSSPARATGVIKDEYLYSVRVGRDAWAKIDFKNLKHIDVVEAISKFELRRQMSKTGSFISRSLKGS